MKIFAVGMNYMEHNKELHDSLCKREEPVIFTKADSALLAGGKPFFVPSFTQQCEYETEIVVRICRLGRSIAQRWAHRYYDQVTVGIDFTARDLQKKCIERGDPWEIAKAFDGSAVISQFVDKEQFEDVNNLNFHLDLNGTTVQSGNGGDMIFSIDKIISYVSQFFTLKTGDIIFTGTPKGVGKVAINDRLEGWLENRKLLNFRIK